ncbi:MAG TPA: WGR domain-containing protein [Arenimonas sp.]|nr:WGR domain-containing protein [Arenimonas sp.]HWS40843.1 WGR domain-containing protein [Arenimonas sp.]
MRVLMQQPPKGLEAPRYVSISLQQDLLGGWTLIRESGLIGGKSQLKREQILDTELAIQAFESARAVHFTKGYQVVFIQGAMEPKPTL